MAEPTPPASDRPVTTWKVWCAVAAVTLLLIGGSAMFIQWKFNTAPTNAARAVK